MVTLPRCGFRIDPRFVHASLNDISHEACPRVKRLLLYSRRPLSSLSSSQRAPRLHQRSTQQRRCGRCDTRVPPWAVLRFGQRCCCRPRLCPWAGKGSIPCGSPVPLPLRQIPVLLWLLLCLCPGPKPRTRYRHWSVTLSVRGRFLISQGKGTWKLQAPEETFLNENTKQRRTGLVLCGLSSVVAVRPLGSVFSCPVACCARVLVSFLVGDGM